MTRDPHLAHLLHADYFATVTRIANSLYMQGDEGVIEGLRLFDLERKNIEAGHAWAVGCAAEDEAAARLYSGYLDAGTNCLPLRLHSHDHVRWLEAALTAACRLEDRAAEARHLASLGNRYTELGQPHRAVE